MNVNVLWFGYSVLMFAGGVAFGIFVSLAPVPNNHFVALPMPDVNGWIHTRTTPVDIKLHVVSEEEFKRDYQGLSGRSFPNLKPCEIDIPAGWPIAIDAQTAARQTVLLSVDDADTLAHEIAHCMFGHWHK